MKELEEIKTRLTIIPGDTKMYQRNIISFNRKISEMESEQKRIKLFIYHTVSKETETVTKEVKGEEVTTVVVRYGNEKLREAAVEARLKTHEEYGRFEKEIEELKDKLQESQLEFDYLRREMRAIEFIVEIIKIEK